jgi:sigma-E factor negative regulatory protein RseB
MRLFGAWIVIGLSFGLVPNSFAQSSDGQELLQQMATAIRSLDYQGSFVYQRAGRVDTLRVFHAGGALERERLINLNGPRSEIIRSGANITCIQADGSATVYTSNSGRGLLPLVPDTGDSQIGEYYEIRIAGKDRVAGYEADVVDVLPRDRFRYGYRLWLDHSTRFLLRSVVADSERRPLEQFMFVSLEIGRLPSDTDLVPRQSQLLSTTAATPVELQLRGAPVWTVNKPPPGFSLSSARKPRNGVAGTEHLVYSDGLANVSIYIEPRDPNDEDKTTIGGRGTLSVYTSVDHDWRFTVLGDVPVATVTAIAKSIARPGPDAPGHP